MWAGNDVHYQHRRGQVIPDPIALYELKPSSGDALERFPSVSMIMMPKQVEASARIAGLRH